MRASKNLGTILTLVVLLLSQWAIGQPKISFTFDDGSLSDKPGYSFETWNAMLLKKLKKHNVQAMFFVLGRGKDSEKGQYLLNSWNSGGHFIANHTWTHPNYNGNTTNSSQFVLELLRTDSLINSYSNYKKYFRFPYLKEGDTPDKAAAFRAILEGEGYKNGYVTIDASDWYIDGRLVRKLGKEKNVNLDAYRDFYLKHIWERAQFYEKLSFDMNKRHIPHSLLLHHNLLAALFIDDLIQMFQEKGWEIVSPEEAFSDPIYLKKPEHAGESLLYALAKSMDNYTGELRYPAEDGKYEKEAMDNLGL